MHWNSRGFHLKQKNGILGKRRPKGGKTRCALQHIILISWGAKKMMFVVYHTGTDGSHWGPPLEHPIVEEFQALNKTAMVAMGFPGTGLILHGCKVTSNVVCIVSCNGWYPSSKKKTWLSKAYLVRLSSSLTKWSLAMIQYMMTLNHIAIVLWELLKINVAVPWRIRCKVLLVIPSLEQ